MPCGSQVDRQTIYRMVTRPSGSRVHSLYGAVPVGKGRRYYQEPALHCELDRRQ